MTSWKPSRGRSSWRHRLAISTVFALAAAAVCTGPAAATVEPSSADAVAAAKTAQNFPMSSDELPLSPGCRTVRTTVPSSVLNHQIVPVPVGSLTAPAQLTINGRLCLPAGGTPKTVLFALHGNAYTSQYWDAGYQPDTYSFARSAMRAGYAVYAIDRLGAGLSSHPLSALVTADSGAEVVHQLIGQLRSGKVGGQPFTRVALLGHSYGTITAWLESAEYNDADALIGTGYSSDIEPAALARYLTVFMPAQLDPKTAPRVGVDAGYLTAQPNGHTSNLLYDLSNVDPAMFNYDQNVLRDTLTVGEGATLMTRFGDQPLGQYAPLSSQEIKVPLPTKITQNIKIPTFLNNGQHDLFFCGADTKDCNSSQALQLKEAPDFAPEACERAAVTPNAGHDLNLQRNSAFSFGNVLTWADQVLGPNGDRLDGYKARCQSFSGANGTGGLARMGVLPIS